MSLGQYCQISLGCIPSQGDFLPAIGNLYKLSISGQTSEVDWVSSTCGVNGLLFTCSFSPMYELTNSKGIKITHSNYILEMHVNGLGLTLYQFPRKYVTLETAWTT